ncbi:MAG: FAD-dependent oxidoreductase [Roseibium sp.]|uniref:flavin monoamine oxidase family protein n=1 Tax=Roseibium sp. TaxID=1936156 RepID=UPI002620B403|nr:FAD-dependent oxidoreductase [Roseibium sp.]MCV0429268.1 FAD-dependent oxidoreductase [Roseibium sp.]
MPISRRSFLSTGLSALGLMGPYLKSVPASASAPKVIVIGAGISGLAAAEKLSIHGLRVTLLEGRERIGGRLWTDRSLGAPLDLGASWIHGIRGNPITKLAKRFSQPLYKWDYDNELTFDLLGFKARALNRFDELAAALLDVAYNNRANSSSVSVAEAIETVSRKHLGSQLTSKEIAFLTASLVELEYAAEAESLSLNGAFEGVGFDGADAVLPEGYDRIASNLAAGLDIRLGTKVDTINYSVRGISVQAGGVAFDADFAICTLPLGVLKTGTPAFDPPLPAEKRRAIELLGMGVLNKIFLAYPIEFCRTDILNFNRISKSSKEFAYWANLYPSTGQPVLCALNAGKFGKELEGLSEPDRRERAHKALQSMFGIDIPAPTASRSSAWQSDAFARGSYSYLPVGADTAERISLAAPLKGTIFFAGEATSLDNPSTVHGAYQSGLKAAEDLLSRTK